MRAVAVAVNMDGGAVLMMSGAARKKALKAAKKKERRGEKRGLDVTATAQPEKRGP